MFENTLTVLPLTDEYIAEMFNLDPDYTDANKEIQLIRDKFISNTHGIQHENILTEFHSLV